MSPFGATAAQFVTEVVASLSADFLGIIALVDLIELVDWID